MGLVSFLSPCIFGQLTLTSLGLRLLNRDNRMKLPGFFVRRIWVDISTSRPDWLLGRVGSSSHAAQFCVITYWGSQQVRVMLRGHLVSWVKTCLYCHGKPVLKQRDFCSWVFPCKNLLQAESTQCAETRPHYLKLSCLWRSILVNIKCKRLSLGLWGRSIYVIGKVPGKLFCLPVLSTSLA